MIVLIKYKIAQIILASEIMLPSFSAFICETGNPDVVLTLTTRTPPLGKEITTIDIVHRRLQDGWFVHESECQQSGLYISSDYRKFQLLHKQFSEVTYYEEHFIRLALESLLARRGYISLHAACVAIGDTAYVFTASSGVGKSTRAIAWQKAFDAELISGDRPLISVKDMTVYGVPWDGKEKCFRNTKAKLHGIYEIRRSKSPYVRQLSIAQKRQMLLKQSFIPMWDSETAAIQIANISTLMRMATIKRIFSGPNAEDAKNLKLLLEQDAVEKEEEDMKIKDGFILREIAGEYLVLPSGDAIANFNGTIALNEISAMVWRQLENPVSKDDLLKMILDEYDVDKTTAEKDLDALLTKLNTFGVLEGF